MTRICTGDRVLIAARDDFYAFVDGWYGRVESFTGGHAVVVCDRADGEKRFLVPPDQLVLALGL